MLNEEKIKIMNKLAMYEQGEGKKYLPVSRYYRSDYIGLAMIKNFFLVTIGYCLILAGIAAYFAEYLIDNVHKMNLVSLGVEVILGYVAVLVLFSVLTYIHGRRVNTNNTIIAHTTKGIYYVGSFLYPSSTSD